jgi:hypothetical protein
MFEGKMLNPIKVIQWIGILIGCAFLVSFITYFLPKDYQAVFSLGGTLLIGLLWIRWVGPKIIREINKDNDEKGKNSR